MSEGPAVDIYADPDNKAVLLVFFEDEVEIMETRIGAQGARDFAMRLTQASIIAEEGE